MQVKGPLDLIGTDALSDLGEEWSSAFRKVQPEANLIFRPKLTKEAVKGFIDGTSLLILTARELTPDEAKAFQAKFSYMPMRIPVCLDANIVFVNKNNPITSITMEQLDAIYSTTRLGGSKAPAVVWGDLGLKGEWAKLPIQPYTRGPGAATRASVAEKVLLKGEFRPSVQARDDGRGGHDRSGGHRDLDDGLLVCRQQDPAGCALPWRGRPLPEPGERHHQPVPHAPALLCLPEPDTWEPPAWPGQRDHPLPAEPGRAECRGGFRAPSRSS